MEGGSRKSGGWRCPSSPEDLELEEQAVRDPAELVDSEAEEEDDTREMEIYELYLRQWMRRRQDIGIIAVPPPAPQSIDFSSRLPVEEAVAEEEDKEKSLPGSSQDEMESKAEDEAVVASPNFKSSGELRVSLQKEELVEVEASLSSTFSIEDNKKEREVPLGGDLLKSTVESLDQVDITTHPNKNSFSSTEGIWPDGIHHSGDLDSSPQPSSSKGAWLNGSLPPNPVDHSDEMMREENNGDAPVEPEQEAGEKTRLVYIPKVEKFKGPAWDSEKDVDEFCKVFNDVFNKMAKESEDEKAKEAARIEEEENRRTALAAMLMEQGDRIRTRLATGAIARKVVTSKEVGHSSPQSCSTLRRQGRKRKASQAETWRETDNELSPMPTLRTPLSPRPGPSVFRAPLPPPPPPPPPTLPTPEPETSQGSEEGLSSRGENDTNSQP